MRKQLITIAISSALLGGSIQHASAADDTAADNSNSKYIGTGIGAVTGAVFAGPVGFIAGGIIGNLAGRQAAVDNSLSTETTVSSTDNQQAAASTLPVDGNKPATIVVAQNGANDSTINSEEVADSSILAKALVENVSLDIFFLTGSTSLEAFYKSRIQALSRLLLELPDADIHLDGYSDRRGDADTNLALSNERIKSVRDALVQAGVDQKRIYMNALGEQQFVSEAGKLEAYSFDRRVAIRLESAASTSRSPIALLEGDISD